MSGVAVGSPLDAFSDRRAPSDVGYLTPHILEPIGAGMHERITDLLDTLGILLVAAATGAAAYGIGLFLTLRGGADWMILAGGLLASALTVLAGSWWAGRDEPDGEDEP